MFQPSLCVSRGTANVLNLNLGMMLLPMCRSLRTWLRGHRLVVRLFPSSLPLINSQYLGAHVLLKLVVVSGEKMHSYKVP